MIRIIKAIAVISLMTLAACAARLTVQEQDCMNRALLTCLIQNPANLVGGIDCLKTQNQICISPTPTSVAVK